MTNDRSPEPHRIPTNPGSNDPVHHFYIHAINSAVEAGREIDANDLAADYADALKRNAALTRS